VKIVMLTVNDEDGKLFDAIRYGAQGYLLKTIRARELVDMLHAAYQGEAAITPALALRMMDEFRRLTTILPAAAEDDASIAQLTPREREVLSLLARGLSDREIAQQLTVSLYTVKSHVRSVLQKLHVASRREAARLAPPERRSKDQDRN
jgi:two-component system NarL family response regulator